MPAPLKSAAVAATTFILILPAPGRAEPIETDEIIVSGGRTPIDAQSYARANTVITGDEMERRQVRTVPDALRLVPGVAVSVAGGAAAVRIRGSEANHVLVLIDGVEPADSSRGYEFNNLAVEHIERIEVLRGPQSALYGAGATAGVINIITRGGIRNSERWTFSAEGISSPGYAVSGLFQGGTDKMDLSLSASQRDDQGWDQSGSGGGKDGRRITSLRGRINADVTNQINFHGTLSYTDRDIEFDGTAFGCGGPDCYVTDAPSSTKGHDLLAAGGVDVSLMEDSLIVSNDLTFSADQNDISDVFGPSSNNASTFKYIGQTAKYLGANDEHALVGALEYKQEKFDSSFLSGEESRDNLGLIGEYRGQLSERVFVQLGGRYDDNDKFKNAFAWSASGSYRHFETGTRLHGSIGQAQTNPTFFEQFGTIFGSFVGNPDLDPEQNFGWDLGVEQAFWGGRGSVDVTYFNERLTDEIVTIFLPTGASTVDNLAGASDRQGVEVGLSLRPMAGLVVGASYTYLDASEATGATEVRRPPHSGGLDVAYTFHDGRAVIGAEAVYTGRTIQSNFGDPSFTSPRVTVSDHVVVNVTGSFAVNERVQIYAGVRNLFDAGYQEVLGYAAQPLTGYIGVRGTF